MAIGLQSLTVPIAATVAGAAGDVQAGTISMMSSAVPGVDTVTNAAALTGGLDAEGDDAFRTRFGNYLWSLSKATDFAVGAAIAAVQQGLSYQIAENVNQTGALQLGHFVVTVDDGSGNPAVALLTAVQEAVDMVRPVGTSFAVQGPVVELANVSMTLVTQAAASHSAAVAAVASATETFIQGLGIGDTLSYSRLAQLAYDASISIMNVSAIQLNGGTLDLVPPSFGVLRAGTVAVS